MKRLISYTMVLMLSLCLWVSVAPNASAAHWADPYLQNLVRRTVMKGDAKGNLRPDDSITRAEFATMMNRAFGFYEKSTKSFKDVPATSWFANDISIAAGQGYMQGDGKGANPNGKLTREEAVSMLCRALKIEGRDGLDFKMDDERNFSSWSRGFINSSVEKGIVNGYADNTFRPQNNITRGEAAKLISEVAGEIVSDESPYSGSTVNGNLTIASSGVTLSNVIVTGDLYITEGVGLGYVNLRNVQVNGEMIISGAGESNVGESSVTLTDCTINNLTVDVAKRKILTLKTDRSTTVENTTIKSSTYLEELSNNYNGFENVTVNGPSGTTLNLRGTFGEVRLLSPGAVLNLYKGEVDTIQVDEAATGAKIFLEKDTKTNAIYFDTGATVTGTGKIYSVLINNDGVSIAQLPEHIYIRPGVTATINGKKMTSLEAEVDGMSPDFASGYPNADKILPTGFTEYYMTNKPGKIYYGVYLPGAPKPSADALLAKNTPPKDALKSGTLNALPEKEATVAVSGQKAGTEYVVYSLFVDLRGKQSEVVKNTVTTVDNVIPTLLAGYPKLTTARQDGGIITVMPNKSTSFYWAVMENKAIAPTVDQLYAQNVPGSKLKGVTRGGTLNTATDIDLSGLQEYTDYMFYVVLRDSADNMSKTPYKLPFTTKDTTPPAFKEDYPKIGAITEKTIPIDYMVDEPCTVYWVSVTSGKKILPEYAGSPDLMNQKSKDIVKNAINVNKSGKATAAKANTGYKITASALESEMPYDFYFLLEDKNGNQSNLYMMEAKTKDVKAPTVALSSAQIIGEAFSVDSPVVMTFSEIVCGAQTDANGDHIRLSKLFADNKNALTKYIRLMDTTPAKEKESPIDWTKVTVEDVNAKTVITFPPEAISLSNNNKYRFDLSFEKNYYIRDTSKNEMKTGTSLIFKTVPPLTSFSKESNFDSTKFHAAFFISPEAQNTGNNIYFDIMLRTDVSVEFKLYSGETMDKLELVNNTTHALLADQVVPITSVIGNKTAYKNLKETYFAIRLTKIENTPIPEVGPTPISKEINLTMNGLIGNNVPSLKGEAATFETRLKDAVDRGDVSVVTNPNPFKLNITMSDEVAPTVDVKSVKYTAGDRQAVMAIKPSKACTVRYYAAPDTKDITQPTQFDIDNATSNTSLGYSAGSFKVEDLIVPTQHTMTGLIPEKKYVVYYYLKGAGGNSDVYKGTFTTTRITSPLILQKLAYQGSKGAVSVTGAWDSDARMHYVVYTTGKQTPTPDDILNAKSTGDPVATGVIDVYAGKQFTLSFPGLEYGVEYDIFAFAQKYVGSEPAGDPSEVALIRRMSPLDSKAPQIKDEIGGSIETGDNEYYRGSVSVGFTEGLYYIFKDTSGSKTVKLTNAALQSRDNVMISKNTDGNVTLTGSPSDCISGITIDFVNIKDGTKISFLHDIVDEPGNPGGKLTMEFHSNVDPITGDKLGKAYWTAKLG